MQAPFTGAAPRDELNIGGSPGFLLAIVLTGFALTGFDSAVLTRVTGSLATDLTYAVQCWTTVAAWLPASSPTSSCSAGIHEN